MCNWNWAVHLQYYLKHLSEYPILYFYHKRKTSLKDSDIDIYIVENQR